MLRRIHRRRRRGAAAVEFAIVAPILLLALVGILEFGRAVMVQQILTNGAREGARKAILPGASTTSVKDMVSDYLDNTSVKNATNRVVKVLDTDGNDLTIENAPSKSPIVVRVSVPYDEISFGLGVWLGGTTLKADVIMRKE